MTRTTRAYNITVQKFEGPLDLLLQLVENKKLEITEISLAEVTEQFLRYLSEVEERFPEELADFLVVAAKLLLIKSRALLPIPLEEEETDTLAYQLRLFQAFKEAATQIEQKLQQGHTLYLRPETKFAVSCEGFYPPQGFTKYHLQSLFQEILKRLEPIVKIPRALITKAISIKEKIAQLQDILGKREKMSFKELMSISTQSRTDVIVTFLAILELVKQKTLAVRQNNIFSDISIEKM